MPRFKFEGAKKVGIPFRMHGAFNPEASAVTIVYNTEAVYQKKEGDTSVYVVPPLPPTCAALPSKRKMLYRL